MSILTRFPHCDSGCPSVSLSVPPPHSRWGILALCTLGVVAVAMSGCDLVPRYEMRQAQLRAAQMYQQNQAVALRLDQANQLAQQEAARAQQLQASLSGAQMALASARDELQIANQRVANYQTSQQELEQRLVSLISQNTNPLSDSASQRFKDLAEKYPQFEFDPTTGVSKFHSDVLFNSGSAKIKRTAAPLLQEFAGIMNDMGTNHFNILIVGHTDDEPIGKPGTRTLHPTNGHLSTNRGHSVRIALQQAGINDDRMGVAGYGPHQPVVANADDDARQLNRRVEIYVLAPDALVAGWDPLDSTRN